MPAQAHDAPKQPAGIQAAIRGGGKGVCIPYLPF
jgi:hypothetical protein